jgi:hypothetical protein
VVFDDNEMDGGSPRDATLLLRTYVIHDGVVIPTTTLGELNRTRRRRTPKPLGDQSDISFGNGLSKNWSHPLNHAGCPSG